MPRQSRRTAAVLSVILLACPYVFPQETRFAVIADTHVGAGDSGRELESIVARINGFKGVEFVVVAGDITENGRDSEFTEAKRILDKLAVPYYALPGNHDSHWVGYGLSGFRSTWPDARFFFQKNNSVFIGLHAWDLGHVSPRDVLWLERQVAELPLASTIIVFIHNPLSSIDNWHVLSNILRPHKCLVISGHVHRNEEIEYNGIPGATVRAAISGRKTGWGFTLVRETSEELHFYEVAESGEPELWGIVDKNRRREVPLIHRPLFENFGVDMLWTQDLKAKLSAPLVSRDEYIYAADDSGQVTCFDLKGNIHWLFTAGAPFVSRPSVVGGVMWATASNRRLFKLEARTGRLLKTADIKEQASSQLVVFPVGAGQKQGLLVGADSGTMICFDAADLERIWTNEGAFGAIQTRPLVAAGKVIFGSWDGRLHCLDAGSGLPLWSWTENDNFYYSPAGCIPQTDGTDVFVCAPDGYVSSVDIRSGRTRWRKKYGAWESIGLSGDRKKILVKSRADEFNIVDTKSGALIRKVSPAHGQGDLLPTEPFEWKGSIFFGAQNGFVYRIDGRGRMSPLLFLGPAAVSTVLQIKDGLFAASNVDGRIAVFRIQTGE